MEGHMTMPILELDDIQSGVLRPRPTPFGATYIVLRIDDRTAGRELMGRLSQVVATAANPESPARDTWVSVALSFQGFKALGVPQASLDSFAPEFQQGMAARAGMLGDVGESGPDNWETPLGSTEVHIAIAVLSPDEAGRTAIAEQARKAHADLQGVRLVWRQDCYQLATGRTSFGFKDGIGQPTVEGSGRLPTTPQARPLKAGEIVLGYPDETGELPPMPTPEVLGRNGSYVVFRKF